MATRACQAISDAFDDLCENEVDDASYDADFDVDLIDPQLSSLTPDSRLLICINGIPNPQTFDEYGPRDSWETNSMLLLKPTGGQDCPYYWTQCATCGYVAEFTGRAARLSCGHGDGTDKDYRATVPAFSMPTHWLAAPSTRGGPAQCARGAVSLSGGMISLSA